MTDVMLIHMLNVTGGAVMFGACTVKYWLEALTHW
jgi:hypothetical protein